MKCTKCKKEKEEFEFWRIITRRTYEVGSDHEGYVEFKKRVKLCVKCRAYINKYVQSRPEYINNKVFDYNKLS